jgi:hypothetical protein
VTTTFLADAWRGPSRPCVWCATPCWNSWQECNKHARRHPWHGRDWQRMVARLEMHKRWDSQYVRRHPEHNGQATEEIRGLEAASNLAWRESRYADRNELDRQIERLRHKVIRVWSGLRAERLRWHWRGSGGMGWKPDFDRAWGLKQTPRGMSLEERLRRHGYTPDDLKNYMLRTDEVGFAPRSTK